DGRERAEQLGGRARQHHGRRRAEHQPADRDDPGGRQRGRDPRHRRDPSAAGDGERPEGAVPRQHPHHRLLLQVDVEDDRPEPRDGGLHHAVRPEAGPGPDAAGAAAEVMAGGLRFLTAGESHGEALVAVIDGVPAGLRLAESQINEDLARRQRGYGRGGRMKIERDQVRILSGVRWGSTLGSPITLQIANRDWENWKSTMAVGAPEPGAAQKQVTRPRPGHADLAGAMKYGHHDIRNVLERSSARETTARVAVAGVAKRLLSEFGISILSHVTEIGGVGVGPLEAPWEEIRARAESSEVRCADPAAERAMI